MAWGPLVDTRWLLEHLGEAGVVVVDCRWQLSEPGAGVREYEAGHVPGAAHLDVDRDLSAPPGPGGRHPLPSAAAFEAAARRAGIFRDSRVVAYDREGEGGAVRLWWLLRHFGHGSAAVLDGGLAAWTRAGGPLEPGLASPPPGDFEATARTGDTIDADELAAGVRVGAIALLDARARERYRGEVEPLDPVAGHIPGARNTPFADLAPGGRFLPPEELAARLEPAGAVEGCEVVAYCGSGVTAATVVLAAELSGRTDVRLYPGSWSEWSRRGLPVERG
jgi:thiosulfate/3-mercaptopyruvate sulfurtransferase